MSPLRLLLAFVFTQSQRQPLPLGRSIELKEDGRVWSVDGRAKLAHDTSISVLKACLIEGTGTENVIELSGSLTLRPNLGGKVVLDNVWIELQPDARELYLYDVQFRGGGLRCAAPGAREPRVFAITTSFDSKAGFSMELFGGDIDLQQCSFSQPVTFKGLQPAEKIPNKVDLTLLGARGMPMGLTIDNIKIVTVRHCDIAGELVTLSNWTKLDFDGNNVRVPRIEFSLPVYGKFSSSSDIHNCDFHCDEITFKVPPDGDKAEKFSIDHCWFRGMTDSKEIVAKMIAEHTRFPRVGVEVDCKRITKGRMGLGGTGSR
jgi:hypothetical protein